MSQIQFETTFNLPNTFADPELSVSLLADNLALVFVNGHFQGFTSDNFGGPPDIFTGTNAAELKQKLRTAAFGRLSGRAGVSADEERAAS